MFFFFNSGKCGTSVSYKLLKDGTLILSGYGEMNRYIGMDNAPLRWQLLWDKVRLIIIEGNVTLISSWAFRGWKLLESVITNNNITEMHKNLLVMGHGA